MSETRVSEKYKKQYYRVRFKVELICKTDIHVGDGGKAVKIEAKRCKVSGSGRDIASKKNLEKYGTYQRCYTRPSGQLVLPGSTLRGFLRRGLDHNDTCRKELFGPEDIGSGEHQGGCLRVMDAHYDGCTPTPSVSYWCSDRKTGLRSGIRINPEKGIQDGKALFYYEVYPQGAEFTAELEMDWVDESEIDALVEALKRWNGDLTHGLGAKKTKSWGVLEVKRCHYQTISTDAVNNWFVDGNDERDIEALFGKHVDVSITPVKEQSLDVPLTLITRQPTLVHDPGQALEKRKNNGKIIKEDQDLPDLVCYRNANLEAALPPESLTGALRATATRIVATLINNQIADPDQAVKDAKKKFVDKIFGDTNQASRIQWKSPAYKGGDVHSQFFIAIDRFTGGVKEGALYCAHAIPPESRLEGGGLILHEKSKWEDWQRGLLYLALREIADGHFWAGWGKAKGYGLLKLVEKYEKGKKVDLATVISNGFGTEVTNSSSEWVKALKKIIVEDYKNSEQEPTKKAAVGDCDGDPEHKDTSVVKSKTPTINRINGEQLNPYAFVPVKALWNSTNRPAYDDIKEKGVRHDLYIPERHTGVITCTLKTVTDTLVGNKHKQPDEETETTVHAYRHAGRVAFSANSLRGMIGSVIETLSQSSLRVFENKYLSVRKLPGKNRPFREKKYSLLSAIGRLRKRGDDWYIEPLTLPHLRSDGVTVKISSEWRQVFFGIPFRECLPAYINRSQAGSYGPGNQDIYKVKTEFNNGITLEGRLSYAEPGLRKKERGHEKNRSYFVLGQRVAANTLEKHETGCADLKSGKIKGYIRELANNGHEFPSGRKHELFIPEPITRRTLIHIPPKIKDKFDRLCRQAISAKNRVGRLSEQGASKENETESLVMPTGYTSHQLQENMLMCFDIGSVGGQLEVSEISFSSIWREQFELETTCEAFTAIDEYLLPWGTLPSRSWLTPAEAMLGVVEEVPNVDSQRNLASRLRFTDGLFIGVNKPKQTDDEVILKILASPKPPSPNLYFHNAKINSKSKIFPNGRKIYLRHHSSQVNPESYRTKDVTENRKQKTICKPIKEGQKFAFDIHYRNLDDDEMKLLLTAIEPGGGFLHKLGLGKPLGLGSVKVEVKCIKERNIKECFTQENDVATKDEPIGNFITDTNDLGTLVDPGTLRCLQETGKERNENELITYPLTRAQRYALYSNDPLIRAWSERELFAWHVFNNKLPNPEKLYSDGCAPSCFSFHRGKGGVNIGRLSFDSNRRKWMISGKEKTLIGRAKTFVQDRDTILNTEVLYIEVKKEVVLIQPISEINSPD